MRSSGDWDELQGNLKAEVIDEGLEVAVAEEEGMATFDASRCDQTVDGLANGDAVLPQRPVVAGGLKSDLDTSDFN